MVNTSYFVAIINIHVSKVETYTYLYIGTYISRITKKVKERITKEIQTIDKELKYHMMENFLKCTKK
jgi:hypothetical protein